MIAFEPGQQLLGRAVRVEAAGGKVELIA